jgi:hypothetical protein
MATVVVIHEVDDVAHWLASTRREEIFGPLGFTIRTFVDPTNVNRVGLVLDVPDVETFHSAMESPEAADGMKSDGVHPETLIVLFES